MCGGSVFLIRYITYICREHLSLVAARVPNWRNFVNFGILYGQYFVVF